MKRRRQRFGEIGIQVIPGRGNVRLFQIKTSVPGHVRILRVLHVHRNREAKPAIFWKILYGHLFLVCAPPRCSSASPRDGFIEVAPDETAPTALERIL
jgi:hypothetical protein